VVEEFATKFAAKAKRLAVGDGSKGETDQGPLINADAMRKVESHVEDAVKKGAVVLCGGERMVFEHAKGGHFYAPTVLVECDSTMKVFAEETFGPVAAIATFTTEDEAIAMANKTRAGLASYVFTRDNATLWRVSEALQYGIVGANTGIISTASAPFGGMRESGIGREGGKHGLEEYLEVKYVCMAGLGDKKNPW
jgi:succinate-semialdehyde dehydrogenase / glutarate-semialdehyde dehydrogenase